VERENGLPTFHPLQFPALEVVTCLEKMVADMGRETAILPGDSAAPLIAEPQGAPAAAMLAPPNDYLALAPYLSSVIFAFADAMYKPAYLRLASTGSGFSSNVKLDAFIAARCSSPAAPHSSLCCATCASI
jgi:hypothetical protein